MKTFGCRISDFEFVVTEEVSEVQMEKRLSVIYHLTFIQMSFGKKGVWTQALSQVMSLIALETPVFESAGLTQTAGATKT
jgi:hypothetical protein